ncbi:TPA: AAA family ATPase [Vibrio cholerae]
MKIKKISVESLFGIFNHEITLNTGDGITIIIGENGLGKTVILESINAFFDERYHFFSDLEFSNFRFYFDNGDVWELTKKNDDGNTALFISKDSTLKPARRIKTHKIYLEDNISNKTYRGNNLSDFMTLKERERTLHRKLAMESGQSQTINNSEKEFHRQALARELFIREIYNKQLDLDIPMWFVEGIKKVNVQLIETQRIITAKESGSDSYVNNLNKCSKELKEMIDTATKESSLVSSLLDSTYPNRLVRKLRQGNVDSFEDLNIALAKLDERRKKFSDAGLSVKISDSDLLQIDENQRNLVNVLKLYIDDSHQKLDPYQDLLEKILLFKRIINKRFKHKTLQVSRDDGLYFQSTVISDAKNEYAIIPHTKLSSGEQHELILFYKLIFNAKPNELILIDEPELSLHISWQNKFINDLKDVTSINHIYIVIATHSPDIIDENWDLKVELKGIE